MNYKIKFSAEILVHSDVLGSALLCQIKMKMQKQRPRPISMQRHSETCSQHYTIEFEVRQIPSSEIIECDRFLHVYWNFD